MTDEAIYHDDSDFDELSESPKKSVEKTFGSSLKIPNTKRSKNDERNSISSIDRDNETEDEETCSKYDDKKIKSKRRSRKELGKRDYRCGCGKSYLSYPALYTHVKQKHDGDNSLITNIPEAVKKGSKGRPTKISVNKVKKK